MKKVIMIACALALAAISRAFAQEAAPAAVREAEPAAKQPPANALSFSVLDLLKLSVGSLSGDVSYARRLSGFDRLRLGLGGDFQRVRNTSVDHPGMVKSRMTYGADLSLENLFIFDRGMVDPYLGIGLFGSLSRTASQDYSPTVATSDTYSCGVVIPLGIEFDATDSFKIGIDGAVGAYYLYSVDRNSVVGLVNFQDTLQARFSSLKVYFSFWF